jgi:hypothetical protein
LLATTALHEQQKGQTFFGEMTPMNQIFVKDLILNASDVYFDEFDAKYCGKVD